MIKAVNNGTYPVITSMNVLKSKNEDTAVIVNLSKS